MVEAFADVEEWEARLRERGWGYFTGAVDEGGKPDVTFEPTEQDEYVESLSPAARQEYDRVLFGELDPTTGTAWRECLSRAGFPGVQTDPNELIDQRMAEEFPTMTFSSNDPRLAELGRWEVSLANAHLDCVEETDLFTAQHRAIARVETEIMERRSAEVEAFVAALREQVGS